MTLWHRLKITPDHSYSNAPSSNTDRAATRPAGYHRCTPYAQPAAGAIPRPPPASRHFRHLRRQRADAPRRESCARRNHSPEGCRTIFNLFAIEGYPHKEIAEMLSISEGTSKSQVNFARKKLQEMLQLQNI